MLRTLTTAALLVTLLSGCAAALVAGGAGVVGSATDRRTLGAQIDDNNVEVKASVALSEDEVLKEQTHINVVSYNGVLLLVGQAPSESLRKRAEGAVKNIQGVQKIQNQIRIANPNSVATRTHDSWLTTKVKSQLLADDRVPGQHIKVITENNEVFLMGIVKGNEGDIAVDLARNVQGVAKVSTVFEYR